MLSSQLTSTDTNDYVDSDQVGILYIIILYRDIMDECDTVVQL